VDDFGYVSDEGPSGAPDVQIEITWNPQPGWVRQLLAAANDTRRELGLPPLA
jgi:hypothetical protein